MPEVICVKTFNSRLEAEIARGNLEANGIESIVSADDGGGWRPEMAFVLGVRLLIKKENEARALEILESSEPEVE
jgi:hypothetical protein